MYTDGVSEAVGPDEEIAPDGALLLDEDDDEYEMPEENMYGEERLYQLLARTTGQNALSIRDSIMGEVTEFCQGMHQSDDITVVVLRRLPETS